MVRRFTSVVRTKGVEMELARLLGLLILGVYGLAISDTETDLKLKILGLKHFVETKDSEYVNEVSDCLATQKRKDIFIDLFGGNYRRRPKLIKVRRKARICVSIIFCK